LHFSGNLARVDSFDDIGGDAAVLRHACDACVVGNVTCHGTPKQPCGMSVLWRANA